MENQDLSSMSDEEIQAEIDRLENRVPSGTNTESTDTVVQPEVQQQQPSTEGQKQMPFGMRAPRPGVGGFVQDVGQGLWENAAPVVGISDTIIDTLNLATPRGIPDIPKLPTYESNTVQAIRNISGLVIPSYA